MVANDLKLVDIEYASIQPMPENLEDNIRRECKVKQETEKERLKRIADMFLARPAYGEIKSKLASEIKNADEVSACNSSNIDMAGNNKKNPEPINTEYAAIHPVTEKADDNIRKSRTVRQETEEERLKRIADMFLARPLYGNVKCEFASDMKKELEEVTSKQMKRGNKNEEKAEQKQNVLKEDNRSDGLTVHKPIEAFVDDGKKRGKQELEEVTSKLMKKGKKNEQKAEQKQNVLQVGNRSEGVTVHKPIEAFVDDGKKRGIIPGCFAFIRVWLEKRRIKKNEKKIMKKSKARSNEEEFTDIFGSVIDAWESDGVRHIVLN